MTVDIKNQTHWTDTKGIATHFNMKPGTIRKQRSKQTKHAAWKLKSFFLSWVSSIILTISKFISPIFFNGEFLKINSLTSIGV